MLGTPGFPELSSRAPSMNHTGLPHESWTPSGGPRAKLLGPLAILIVPALIFAAFAAYAWLAPSTYRATALITVETPVGAGAPGVPPNAAQRLRDAALDPITMAQVAREFALGDSPAALAEANRRLLDSFQLVATGTQTFEVSFTAAEPEPAQRLCNLLARGAAAKATQALAGEGAAPVTANPSRERRVAELDAFLAAHPELVPPTVAPFDAGTPGKDAQDKKLAALKVERDQLQLKIAKLAQEESSDNPYGEASGNEARRLQKRVEEINGQLKRANEKKPSATAKVTPEVEREWQRLREAVDSTKSETTVRSAAVLIVRLSEAALPTSAIDPNRSLLLVIGTAAALFVGMVLVALRYALRPRRASMDAQHPAEPTLVTSSSAPPAKFSSAPPAKLGSDPPNRPGSIPPPPRGSDPAPAPHANPEGDAQASVVAHPSMPPAPVDVSGPLRPAVTHAVGAATDRSQSSLSGFAIVPAPIRTPLPPQHPDVPSPAVAASPPAAATPPPAVAPPAPENAPLPTQLIPPAVAPRPGGSPATSTSIRPPAMPDRPGQPIAGIIVSKANPEISRTPPLPVGRSSDVAGGLPSRTLTGPFGPSPGAPEPERQTPKARGRTTQMLGSPIAPVVRSSRPPAATRSTTSSTPLAPSPRPSGYSYVNTAPPPHAGQPQTRPTPAYFSTPPGTETSGYLSTPAPAHGQSSAPPGRDRGARPAITTRPVPSTWRPHTSIRFEAQRQLADQLFPLAVEKCFVVGVTAVPEARNGKSRIAVELALALGEARHPRVLLVEGDFQWPSLHTVLQVEMPRSAGFSQQLRDRSSGTADEWNVLELGPALHLMAEGIMRSPGLILSSHFEEAMHSFRSYYDFVIVDGPLTSSEIDCRAFDAVIDGVVLVSTGAESPSLTRAIGLFPDKRFSTIVTM